MDRAGTPPPLLIITGQDLIKKISLRIEHRSKFWLYKILDPNNKPEYYSTWQTNICTYKRKIICMLVFINKPAIIHLWADTISESLIKVWKV